VPATSNAITRPPQTALVTGASSGLGRALARQLAARGWRVGLIARSAEGLAQTRAEITAAGGEAELYPADVTCERQVAAAVDALTGQLGPIDLLIANAGFAPPESVRPLCPADIRQMMEVNYLGMIHAVAAVLPSMLERGRGWLAAVSSLAAYRGLPSMSGYAASKAAVNAFTEGLRLELRGSGVGVTTACPGYIDTPMTANNIGSMPLLMTADQAARRILRSIERRRSVDAFPWPLAAAMQLARHAPDWLVDLLSPREIPAQTVASSDAGPVVTRPHSSPASIRR
jgi:short-subunit dehydrogenase